MMVMMHPFTKIKQVQCSFYCFKNSRQPKPKIMKEEKNAYSLLMWCIAVYANMCVRVYCSAKLNGCRCVFCLCEAQAS